MRLLPNALVFIAAVLFGYGVVEGNTTLTLLAAVIALAAAVIQNRFENQRPRDWPRFLAMVLGALVVGILVGLVLSAVDAPTWLAALVIVLIALACCTGPVRGWIDRTSTA